MAIVKKDLFEAGLISAFKEVSVAEAITVKPSRVDGKTITFTKMGNVALHDYTGTIAEDSIETTAITMLMDKKKYFAVAVDDAEQVFATAELLIPVANEGAYAMKEDVETAILGEAVKSAKVGNVIGASASKKAITKPEEAYDYIVQMGTNLDNEKVPVMNRFVIARPEFVNMLCKDARVLAHANQQVLPNGITAIDVNGMTVVKNNFVPANAVVAMHNSAIGFGRALDKVETYRSQSSFSDVIKLLTFVFNSMYLKIRRS